MNVVTYSQSIARRIALAEKPAQLERHILEDSPESISKSKDPLVQAETIVKLTEGSFKESES